MTIEVALVVIALIAGLTILVWKWMDERYWR